MRTGGMENSCLVYERKSCLVFCKAAFLNLAQGREKVSIDVLI